VVAPIVQGTKQLRAIFSTIILAGTLLPLDAYGMEMVFAKDDVGQLWLQMTGRIEDGDDVKFKEMLVGAINRSEQVENVSIYSPGGQLIPAMKIGGYIRAMHLTTVAPELVPLLGQHVCRMHDMGGRTIVTYDPRTRQGDPRCTCAGECFLIWAAGLARLGNAVQIHRIALQGDDAESASGATTTDMHAGRRKAAEMYLREMGAPETAIGRMFSIGPDKLEYLTKDERGALADNASVPWLKELLRMRCQHHAASSPAALACEKGVIRELYWRGARQLLSQNE
jgi:hypothetical protein